MLIWSWCLAAVMAGNPNKRPIDKKIEHLKRAGPDMVNMYFIDAKPDGNNSAHLQGTLKNLQRREAVAGRLNVSFHIQIYLINHLAVRLVIQIGCSQSLRCSFMNPRH